MSKIRKIITPLALLTITLFSVVSCAPAVSQQEYDRVNNELSETKTQIATLQSQLAIVEKVQGQYQELNKSYEALKKQLDIKIAEVETTKSQYNDLAVKYEDLKKLYEGPVQITEGQVEQAIFELLNQERTNNGLHELIWGVNLHTWAQLNSRHMAQDGKFEYSEYASWQEVFWAAGYNTVDRIADGALITWRSNLYRYEKNILTKVTYGAIGVYKSGEIFYITYMADVFK